MALSEICSQFIVRMFMPPYLLGPCNIALGKFRLILVKYHWVDVFLYGEKVLEL